MTVDLRGRLAQQGKETAAARCTDAGLLLLLAAVSVVVLASVLFFFGVSVTPAHLILGVAAGCAAFFLLKKEPGRPWPATLRENLAPVLAACGVIALSLMLMSFFVDYSWDGNAYHKLSIGLLKNGWNPVYQNASAFALSLSNPGLASNSNYFWTEHYPKASWLFGAAAYALTGSVESGKALNIILAVSAFLMAFGYLRLRFFRTVPALLAGAAFVFSPVVLVQLFSFYLDGALAALFDIMTLSLVMLTDRRCPIGRKLCCAALFCSIVFLCNIKLTGLAYAGVFCLAFYLLWLVRGRSRRVFLRSTAFFAFTFLFSVAGVGFSTYIKNWINNGNPFYPLLGAGKVDVIYTGMPAAFSGRSQAVKLLIALFARVNNLYASNGDIRLKLPFSFTWDELNTLSAPDLRFSGFGVWFSGALLVCAAVLAAGMVVLFRRKSGWFAVLCALLVPTAALLLGLDGSWYARYAPYLYFIPALAVVMAAAAWQRAHRRLLRTLAAGVAAVVVINAGFTLVFGTGKMAVKALSAGRQLDRLASSGGSLCVRLTTPSLKGLLYDLDDRGLSYQLTEDDIAGGELLCDGEISAGVS